MSVLLILGGDQGDGVIWWWEVGVAGGKAGDQTSDKESGPSCPGI